MKLSALCMALTTAMISVPTLAAAEWPEKPVELVINFEPGGGVDQVMLPMKPLLEKELGQPLLYSYKPGAGGRIGFEYVTLRGNEGYVIGALSQPHFSSSTVFDTPRYKLDDIRPVGLIGRDVPIWFVRKDSPFKTMEDVIKAARERPNEIKVATGSFTGEQYLTLAILEDKAKIQLRAVNVRGGGAVISNILGGHFDVGIIRPASISSIADQIRALGVVAPARSPLFPDAPTFDEQLPKELAVPHFSSTRGLFVTTEFANANPQAFKRLEEAVKKSIQTDDYKAAMTRMGYELEWVGPEAALAEVHETARQMQEYKALVEAAKHRK